MFVGHFGVGFAAKAAAPSASLGTFFLAAQFVDLLWPTFLLLGIERVRIQPGITAAVPLDFSYYPFTHSLAGAVAWAVLVSAAYYLARRDRRVTVLLGLAVISHWLLDAVTHRPDLPVFPGSGPLVGLGLWSSVWGTVVVEAVLFTAGVWLYARATRAFDRIGNIGFWALVVFLGVAYVMNLFSPPPPTETAIAWVGQAQWLIVAWGYWIDRHRAVAGFSRPSLAARVRA